MKISKKTIGLAALLFCVCLVNATSQNYRQTLKGVVLDKKLRQPLPGATVLAGDVDTLLQGITDAEGRFRIGQVPVGRQTIRVRYIGYKELMLSDIEVQTGKETDLVLELEENAFTSKEVVVSAQSARFQPLNPFATGSARSFSVEETQRYAAAANDPARMASAFAGVAVPGDDNNTIVIRGNAPNGLLWRLEGIDIPNPNHFSNAGATGGAISVLSAQVLAGSDFFTGAFPAEYGNALSGVFDLKLRKGNTERREYTLQAGLLGLESALEGPLRIGRQSGSFLFNYRFSSLFLLSKMGIELGDLKTRFQDLSFHLWLPAGKAGEFSLFGVGGLSAEKLPGQPDSLLWRVRPDQRFNSLFRSDMGILGMTHQKQWNRMYWKQVLAWTGSHNVNEFERYETDYTLQPISRENYRQERLTFSSVLNYKANSLHFFRSGVYATFHHFQLAESVFQPAANRSLETIGSTGQAPTGNAFFQWQARPADALTINAGVHAFFFFLNKKRALEPRVSMQYNFSKRQSLGISYGLHSQMQPIGVYFTKDSAGQRYNPDLDFTKAQHFVANYRLGLNRFWQFKTELYYQHLYWVPVSATISSSFSMLNETDGFVFEKLINAGSGRNYGLELSLERPLAKGYYLLWSASLYRSKYRASDGIWRNTRFNGNYLSNFVCGREWNWNRNGRRRSVAVNLKVTHFGGLREAPVDRAASEAAGFTVRDYGRDFEFQLPAYFRIDPGFRLKRFRTRATSTFFMDIQNMTNRQNVSGSFYDFFSREVAYTYQEGLIPIVGYKVEF